MDPLFPYDIVEENGFYGLKDSKGNFVVENHVHDRYGYFN